MDAVSFTVKEEHLKLMQRMNVDWHDCEFGAPAIDCKRPYGNGAVFQDMIEILGLEKKPTTSGSLRASINQKRLERVRAVVFEAVKNEPSI